MMFVHLGQGRPNGWRVLRPKRMREKAVRATVTSPSKFWVKCRPRVGRCVAAPPAEPALPAPARDLVKPQHARDHGGHRVRAEANLSCDGDETGEPQPHRG